MRGSLAPALALLATGFVGVTHAAFSGGSQNTGNVVAAAPDWVPPSASGSVAQKPEGGETGYLRDGSTFRVYAQVSDGGNPPSGTASVRAEVPNSGFAIPMTAGAFTVDGQSFNWGSAATAVPAGTPAGTYAYDVLMTDNLGQAGTSSGFSVQIDNTAPTATDVQTASGGAPAQPGRPNTGDTVTLTFGEPLDRVSVAPGWTAGTAAVTVRIFNGTGAVNDSLIIDGASFGTIQLGRNDYVTAETTFTGSSLTRNTNQLQVTLGTRATGGAPPGGVGTGTMTLTPSTAAFDRAGNRVQAINATESGAADREF